MTTEEQKELNKKTLVAVSIDCGCGFHTASVVEAQEHVAHTGHAITEGKIAVRPSKNGRH